VTTSGTPGDAALLFIRDPALHTPRRRIWDRAFNVPALRAYTPLLLSRLSELLSSISAASSTASPGAVVAPAPVDLQHWIHLMALDWMGDFAWGGLFHAMESGHDEAGFAAMGARSVGLLDVLGTVPWVGPLVRLLLPARMRQLRQTAQEVVQRRRREGARTRDLFTVLVRSSVLVIPPCA
jgi:cytochrome P450